MTDTKHTPGILDTLEELADYFEQRMDVEDGPDGTLVPNLEMQLLAQIDEVVAKARGE